MTISKPHGLLTPDSVICGIYNHMQIIRVFDDDDDDEKEVSLFTVRLVCVIPLEWIGSF